MAERKNIVLTGMMGCGKTSVSAALKNLLPEFTLVEMDSVIEECAGMTINKIFETLGEEHFRNLEKQLLNELSEKNQQIISTGGGVFLSEENRNAIMKDSFTVYLSADTETIYERIKHDNSRPLLKSKDQKEHQSNIEELIKARTPHYKLAHAEVSTIRKTPQEIAEEILEKYKNYGN